MEKKGTTVVRQHSSGYSLSYTLSDDEEDVVPPPEPWEKEDYSAPEPPESSSVAQALKQDKTAQLIAASPPAQRETLKNASDNATTITSIKVANSTSTGMPVEVPAAPAPGSEVMTLTIPGSSIPNYTVTPDPDTDPRFRTLLPDISGGSIDLDGQFLGGSRYNTPVFLERYPTLPFWPSSYSRNRLVRRMRDIEVFIRAYKIKQVPDWQFQLSNGWKRLPNPAPVFVNVPKFGVGVALYWRWGNTFELPILYYAIRKLTPIGVYEGDPYVGATYEVFASWCKPLKWAISQFWPNYDAALVMTDEGTEFQVTCTMLKNSDDVRVKRARNALVRLYRFLEPVLAIKRIQPPQDLVQEAARKAAAYQQRYATSGVVPTNPALQSPVPVQGGFYGRNGQVPTWNATPQYIQPNAARPMGGPPTAPKAKRDDDDEEENADEEPPATAASGSSYVNVSLSSGNSFRVQD